MGCYNDDIQNTSILYHNLRKGMKQQFINQYFHHLHTTIMLHKVHMIFSCTCFSNHIFLYSTCLWYYFFVKINDNNFQITFALSTNFWNNNKKSEFRKENIIANIVHFVFLLQFKKWANISKTKGIITNFLQTIFLYGLVWRYRDH